MLIAAHVLAYNVSRFFPFVLDNICPHVDKVFIAYPSRPWAYNESSRTTKKNPTTLQNLCSEVWKHKVEIIQGDWERDEDTRNSCLEKAKAEGFEFLITQDADEFYTENSWDQIISFLRAAPPNVDAVCSTWYNFWKSPQYIISDVHGSIKDVNANLALRCRPGVYFQQSRTPNVPSSIVIDAPCYHYGWAMNDEEMQEKLSTWTHTNDFDTARWFRIKWLNWRESTRHLNPHHPFTWYKAVRFPCEQPSFATQFALNVDLKKVTTPFEYMEECIYDSAIVARWRARKIRASMKLTSI
jgi:hypothetical protein